MTINYEVEGWEKKNITVDFNVANICVFVSMNQYLNKKKNLSFQIGSVSHEGSEEGWCEDEKIFQCR
jgi:hypothetical protein